MRPSSTADVAAPVATSPRLAQCASPEALPAGTLGAIVYGRDAPAECAALGDPRVVGVALDAVPGGPRVEAWSTDGPVQSGELCGVRYQASERHLFAVLELDESLYGGACGTSREAYRRLVQFQDAFARYHVYRIWNFFDAINEGSGDDERYRQFCLGRAEGLGTSLPGYPAGSALGRRDGARRLQVIWLAGRTPPLLVENPRQVSAYRYPRQYGPASPSFSRAVRIGDDLLISGTASIVGHETRHGGDVRAQTAESLLNLRAVVESAGLDAASLGGIKAYVRHLSDVAGTREELERGGFPQQECCLLLADICRRDLLVELEAIGAAHAPSQAA